MTVLLERNGREETVQLRPQFDAEGARWLAGVTVAACRRQGGEPVPAHLGGGTRRIRG